MAFGRAELAVGDKVVDNRAQLRQGRVADLLMLFASLGFTHI